MARTLKAEPSKKVIVMTEGRHSAYNHAFKAGEICTIKAKALGAWGRRDWIIEGKHPRTGEPLLQTLRRDDFIVKE